METIGKDILGNGSVIKNAEKEKNAVSLLQITSFLQWIGGAGMVYAVWREDQMPWALFTIFTCV